MDSCPPEPSRSKSQMSKIRDQLPTGSDASARLDAFDDPGEAIAAVTRLDLALDQPLHHVDHLGTDVLLGAGRHDRLKVGEEKTLLSGNGVVAAVDDLREPRQAGCHRGQPGR